MDGYTRSLHPNPPPARPANGLAPPSLLLEFPLQILSRGDACLDTFRIA